ncbi:hypothetical protein GCM10023210_31070 [Chryseobacterium ginsengisoli]|uniref:Uncharacterized protein n=1 Tax=Chryseobacterium ginsengisoli TaxID=363853 RepID=A0ABP9MMI7_9FLAO
MEIMEKVIIIGGNETLSLPLRIYEKLKDLENEIENFPFVEDQEKARITGRQTFADFAILYNKITIPASVISESAKVLTELGKICNQIKPLDFSSLEINSPTNPNLRNYKSKKQC